MGRLIFAVAAVALAGCVTDKTDEVPKIKLPFAPQSETIDCAQLSADDLDKCRADPASRPICRAALKNCVRLENLQQYNKTLRDQMEGS